MHTVEKIITLHIEVITAILIGLATLGIGYTTYTASLWGSSSVENYSKSNNLNTEANTTYLEGVIVAGDDITEDEKTALQQRYESEKDESNNLQEQADQANKNGDSYQLQTVILSTGLFLASIATLVKSRSLRLSFVSTSFVVVLVAVIRVISLPRP